MLFNEADFSFDPLSMVIIEMSYSHLCKLIFKCGCKGRQYVTFVIFNYTDEKINIVKLDFLGLKIGLFRGGEGLKSQQ